jgi:hypothetical protein
MSTSVNRKNSIYIVRQFDGCGERYLVKRSTSRGYRWAKGSVVESAVLSYETARKAVHNYGGNMVAVNFAR